jgi:deazaflavin-dependent oxidoreductase (nitroreductase family)
VAGPGVPWAQRRRSVWFRRPDQTTPATDGISNQRSPTAETATEYNAKIIAEFRANQGRVGGTWEDIPLLLLHHTGAQSGVSRVNPVAYLLDDPRYFIWAANGGAPKHPAWYQKNLKAHPITRIEVGGETIDVIAEEADGDERKRLFAKATGHYPQLADAANRTTRVIPIVVLTPRPSA